MSDERVYSVIGGDMRSGYVAQLLIEQGRRVMTAGLELSGLVAPPHINTVDDAARRADIVILPLPLIDKNGQLKDGFSSEKIDVFSILSMVKQRAWVFGGMIPAEVQSFADERGVCLSDYYLRGDFLIKNALPTAEGTVETLMKKLPITIFSSSVAVVGFGRCGEAVSLLLKGMGARVTIYARRKETLARAECLGLKAKQIDALYSERLSCDALVNTVPARVITKAALDRLSTSAVVVDLASAPGGVDFAYAAKRGIDAFLAPSLPGRVAPKTAGKIIIETVLNILDEKGE